MPENPFKRATTSSAAVVDSQLSLARLAERRNDFTRAKQIYHKVVKRAPQNAVARHRLGVILAQEGSMDEAFASLNAALEIAPSADLLADIGYAHFLHGNLEEANRILQNALESSPYNKRVINNLALVAGHRKNYSDSLALFRRANNAAEAHANLAYVMTQNGDIDQAADEYHRALDYDKNLKMAANALVQIQDQLQSSNATSPLPNGPSQLASFAPSSNAVSDATRIPSISPSIPASANANSPNAINSMTASQTDSQVHPKLSAANTSEKPPTLAAQGKEERLPSSRQKSRAWKSTMNAVAASKAKTRAIQQQKTPEAPSHASPTTKVATNARVTRALPHTAHGHDISPHKDANTADPVETIKQHLARSKAITPRPPSEAPTTTTAPSDMTASDSVAKSAFRPVASPEKRSAAKEPAFEIPSFAHVSEEKKNYAPAKNLLHKASQTKSPDENESEFVQIGPYSVPADVPTEPTTVSTPAQNRTAPIAEPTKSQTVERTSRGNSEFVPIWSPDTAAPKSTPASPPINDSNVIESGGGSELVQEGPYS